METQQLPNLSRYRICENGAIQKVNNNRYMTWEITSLGYARVGLTFDNGTKKHIYVHQLVGQAFLENPNNLTEINHKDENKLNNHYSNLEWCTRQYNNTYGSRAPENRVYNTTLDSLRGTNNAKPVVMCDINTHDAICFFCSSVEANRVMNISGSAIRRACKRTPEGGISTEYWWRYATQEEIEREKIKFETKK